MKSGLVLTIFTLSVLLCGNHTFAQSTSQNFPTPVTTNEINGSIKARDIGDSRLTTYFYTFSGDQGDLFINIVTRNFTGDLDVFTTAGLRPITKIVIYANDSENETGRAVYFRKTEKLLLRVQGRSPNDDPASFRIKFAGSFVAANESDTLTEPELPKITTANATGIRVNSVGTILPAPPKPVIAKTEPVAPVETSETVESGEQPKTETVPANEQPKAESVPTAEQPKTETVPTVEDAKTEAEKPKGVELIVTDNLPRNEDAIAAKPVIRKPTSRRKRTPAKPIVTKSTPDAAETKNTEILPADMIAETKSVESPPVKRTPSKRKTRKAKKTTEATPDPLASIRLVVAFKDGKTLEKQMNEVFKFSVDKGILTVILKDGSISRYPIVNVAKVTIE
ncbi:MAG: hypothetical protein WBD27_14890 [Pyrinomonadaceae bacterium]